MSKQEKNGNIGKEQQQKKKTPNPQISRNDFISELISQ